MSEYAKTIIKAEADRIRQELIAPGHVGMLYGEPIDMNDPDAVLVAAVWKAKHEEMLKSARSMDAFFGTPEIRRTFGPTV